MNAPGIYGKPLTICTPAEIREFMLSTPNEMTYETHLPIEEELAIANAIAFRLLQERTT